MTWSFVIACKASSYKALGVSTQAAFDVGVKAKKGGLVAITRAFY
jgi:hypothetical protein